MEFPESFHVELIIKKPKNIQRQVEFWRVPQKVLSKNLIIFENYSF